jgi:hypothetical protein
VLGGCDLAVAGIVVVNELHEIPPPCRRQQQPFPAEAATALLIGGASATFAGRIKTATDTPRHPTVRR